MFYMGLVFIIVDVMISGALGMMAWNMCIPVMFEGVPQLTLLQSIIIAMVFDIMTYGGRLLEDKTDTGEIVSTALTRMVTIIINSGFNLVVLWIIMQMAY